MTDVIDQDGRSISDARFTMGRRRLGQLGLGASAATLAWLKGGGAGGASAAVTSITAGDGMSVANINIANAPGWRPNTAYAVGSRVVAGPGWTGGKFVNGAPLWLWALEGGAGTSGKATSPFPVNPTPVGVGGGFDGVPPVASWLSAVSVRDNNLTWICLSPVDYVTFTDAMTDGAGTVTTYSSKANIWPHQIGQKIQFNNHVTITVWYGGVARPVYQGGKDGEANPIPMQDHLDFGQDHEPQCMTGGGAGSGCNGMKLGQFWFVRAAPGDSHIDRRAPGWQNDPTVRVDPSLGVTFFSDSPGNDNPGTGTPLGFSDSFGTFTGIQFHAKNWLVCPAHGFYLPGHGHTNSDVFNQCILQSDAGPGVVACDAGFIFQDCVIIYLGSTRGAFGVVGGYSTDFTRTKFIGSGRAPDSVAIVIQVQGIASWITKIQDCDFKGFSHDWAFGVGQKINVTGASGNTTDLPASYTGGTITLSLPGFGAAFTAAPVPGKASSEKIRGKSK